MRVGLALKSKKGDCINEEKIDKVCILSDSETNVINTYNIQRARRVNKL